MRRIAIALDWLVLVAGAIVDVFDGQVTVVSIIVKGWDIDWVMVLETPKPLSINQPLIIDTKCFSHNDFLAVPRIFTPTITDQW